MEPKRVGVFGAFSEREYQFAGGEQILDLGFIKDVFALDVGYLDVGLMQEWQNGHKVFVFGRNDRYFVAADSTGEKRSDLLRDEGVFGLIGLEFAQFNIGIGGRVFGSNGFVDVDVWSFTESVNALLDDIVCEVEDGGAGAIVLREKNMLWVISVVKIEEI